MSLGKCCISGFKVRPRLPAAPARSTRRPRLHLTACPPRNSTTARPSAPSSRSTAFAPVRLFSDRAAHPAQGRADEGLFPAPPRCDAPQGRLRQDQGGPLPHRVRLDLGLCERTRLTTEPAAVNSIFGIDTLPNGLLLADSYAANGYATYMPDRAPLSDPHSDCPTVLTPSRTRMPSPQRRPGPDGRLSEGRV